MSINTDDTSRKQGSEYSAAFIKTKMEYHRAIVRSRALTPQEKVLALHLLHNYTNQEMFDLSAQLVAFPGKARLRKDFGRIDKRWIETLLETLSTKGVFTRRSGQGGKPDTSTTCRYCFNASFGNIAPAETVVARKKRPSHRAQSTTVHDAVEKRLRELADGDLQ